MLLTFDKVTFRYDKKITALEDISFSLEKGEKVALVGLNGSGKTTLMLHTNGLLVPESGKVKVNGHETDAKDLMIVRQTVGLVFQNPDDQLFMPTVKDDVAFGPRNMNLSKAEVDKRVEEALLLTETSDLRERAPFELSGGQKKLVSIATVLSMRPELLVMDEPSAGLDYEGVNNFVKIINSLDVALLLSTHDIQLAKELCSRAIVLEKGSLVYDGPIESVPYPH